jgi:uncharacterized protein with GYD domain
MPVYMMQMAYTSEVWATLVKNPEDRTKSAQSLAESLGGRSLGFWLSFGEYDLLAIFEMPDAVSIAALAMAVAAGGALKDIKTTPLISTHDGVQAMSRAQTLAYTPPGVPWSARKSWSETTTT